MFNSLYRYETLWGAKGRDPEEGGHNERQRTKTRISEVTHKVSSNYGHRSFVPQMVQCNQLA